MITFGNYGEKEVEMKYSQLERFSIECRKFGYVYLLQVLIVSLRLAIVHNIALVFVLRHLIENRSISYTVRNVPLNGVKFLTLWGNRYFISSSESRKHLKYCGISPLPRGNFVFHFNTC